MDELFRESKDKENANALFSKTTTIDNAFGFVNNNPQMSNPFQAVQINTINGFGSNQFPVMFNNTSPNMLTQHTMSGVGIINGNHFLTNGNGAQQQQLHQQYQNAYIHPNASNTNNNNNFQQRNPFAVSNILLYHNLT